jgi:hypothetical protein
VPSPDDHPSGRGPRRPLFFPVVIAAVFLTIIGMSVGLVLGARAKDRTAAPPTQAGPTQVQPSTPAAEPCRPETQAAARRHDPAGTLVIVLQIRTATSAVWICADEAGRMYYHANRGGVEAAWIEGQTALFLPDVVAYGDGYRATATDDQARVTTFDVSSERLLITHKDGREENQPAV